MKNFILLVLIANLAGCVGLKPPAYEVSLPEQKLLPDDNDENSSHVVIFNSSNTLFYDRDTSGKMNISINGKGVGQLKIGEFLVLELDRGLHKVQLTHQDIFKIESTHTLHTRRRVHYIDVYAQPFSNGFKHAKRIPRNYKAAYD